LSDLDRRQPGRDSPFPGSNGVRLEGFLEDQGLETASDMEVCVHRSDESTGADATPLPAGPCRVHTGWIWWCTTAPRRMPAALSSTGEQKALLIGIILGHAQLVRSLTGHAPILLLDEVAAHLDEGRRAALFDLIETLDCQAFMTGTDAAMFESLGPRGQMFEVSEGRATPRRKAAS
jgi:DNA replication and repair protein RecF